MAGDPAFVSLAPIHAIMDKGNATLSLIYSIQVVLLYFCMTLCSTVVPILSIVYYRNRRHPILKARRAEWSLVYQILIVIGVEAFGYKGLQMNLNCAEVLFVHVVVCTITLYAHIIRCWLLLYNWNVSKALCEVQSDLTESHKNWWLRHAHLASNKWMTLVTVVATVLHILWWLTTCAIHGWERSFSEPIQYPVCTSSILWQFAVTGPLVLHMLFGAYLSYAIRLVVDVFQIKRELMMAGASWLYIAVPWWAVALWFPSLMQYPNYTIMMALAVNLCGVRVLYLTIVKPLWMIYIETRNRCNPSETSNTSAILVGTTSSGNDDEVITGVMPLTTVKPRPAGERHHHRLLSEIGLRRMLDTNTGIASDFVHFLIKEFSVENWRFYSDVLQLRILYGGWKPSDAGSSGLQSGHLEWFREQGAAAGSLEESINRIYSMYLAESAQFEVNLSCEQQREIRRCFGPNMRLRPSCIHEIPAVLCKAQDAIFDFNGCCCTDTRDSKTRPNSKNPNWL